MILLLGGTTESLEVADVLRDAKVPFIISVISDYGVKLAAKHTENVVKITFTTENFPSFCQGHHIKLILDATHPLLG